MDSRDFKERYITENEHLEIEEIFVAAKRHDRPSQGHEFVSFTGNKCQKSNEGKLEEAKTDLMGYIDRQSPQKAGVTDDEQPNSTAEYSGKWNYVNELGPQQHTDLINTKNQNYDRNASGKRELNLMTDGVYVVQHNSQRMDEPYNEFKPTRKLPEEWEYSYRYGKEKHLLEKNINSVFRNPQDISANIGEDSQQSSQKLETSYNEPSSTKKLLVQRKSSDKSRKDNEDISRNKDAPKNKMETTCDNSNSRKKALEKWETCNISKKENQCLADDVEHALRNHEKVISRDTDKKFTFEMDFSPMDLPFNIRVEPSKELDGFTASVINIDINESSQASKASGISKNIKPNFDDGNRNRPAENPLKFDIEVVPLTVDQNFNTDLDKGVFREQCVRRILEDDHKTRQTMEPISVVQSSSKNQSRPPIFLRDTPTKSVEEFKDELTSRESVFERDFARSKPNDVLQSWVQLMEGFLEDQKHQLRRRMYQIDEEDELLEKGHYNYDRRRTPNSRDSYDKLRYFEPFWCEKDITEATRMISRNQLYPSGIPKAVPQSKSTTDAAKKEGIMKKVKRKEIGTTQKSQLNRGKNKDSKKIKRKFGERKGPEIRKPDGPVFRPPPLKVQKQRKSFIKDIENPIKRSPYGFGLIRKIPT